MRNVIFPLIFLFLTAAVSRAAEIVEINTSLRALGMGNAYTAVAGDKDALFYNPAGLAKVRGINWTIMNPGLGVDGMDVIDTVTSAQQSGNINNTLRNLFGKNLWLGGGGETALTLPGFGVSLYDSAQVAAYLSNPAFPDMNLRYINDYGVAIGAAMEIGPAVQVGVVGKRITRAGADVPVGLSLLGLSSNQALLDTLSNQGTGYAVDLGVNLVIPSPSSPTFSVVWKQIGSTVFTRDSGQQAPPPITDEIVVGFASTIDLPGLDITPAIDVKHINDPEEPLGKKIHFGAEFAFPFLRLRAGMYQGYWTLGTGLDLPIVKLDAATYGVELGEYPGQKQDRRFLLSATFEIGFDPSFMFGGSKSSKGGGGSGGSGSSVKPRR